MLFTLSLTTNRLNRSTTQQVLPHFLTSLYSQNQSSMKNFHCSLILQLVVAYFVSKSKHLKNLFDSVLKRTSSSSKCCKKFQKFHLQNFEKMRQSCANIIRLVQKWLLEIRSLVQGNDWEKINGNAKTSKCFLLNYIIDYRFKSYSSIISVYWYKLTFCL